jgi:tRNA pseudouridine38-40 synthase
MHDATPYVRATVAYDGTDFAGFQWQSNGRTVQGTLEDALARVCGIRLDEAPSRIVGAGRTDAGVHAAGQVIGFETVWQRDLPALQRALNAVLPEDVVVLELGPAQPEWHARFSAVRRVYRYRVLNRLIRWPLERRFTLHVEKPLNLEAMNAGAAHLIGEHDFASFGQPMIRTDRQGLEHSGSTVRCIEEAVWQQEGEHFTFDVTGNAFLRGMVRSIVGALLQVGLGQWPDDRMSEVLAARNRAVTAAPAPACGLCLMRVDYESGPSTVFEGAIET